MCPHSTFLVSIESLGRDPPCIAHHPIVPSIQPINSHCETRHKTSFRLQTNYVAEGKRILLAQFWQQQSSIDQDFLFFIILKIDIYVVHQIYFLASRKVRGGEGPRGAGEGEGLSSKFGG